MSRPSQSSKGRWRTQQLARWNACLGLWSPLGCVQRHLAPVPAQLRPRPHRSGPACERRHRPPALGRGASRRWRSPPDTPSKEFGQAHGARAEITAPVGVSRSRRPETATSFRDRSGWDRPGCTRQHGRSPCSARTALDSGGGSPNTGPREPRVCHRAGPRRRGSPGAG